MTFQLTVDTSKLKTGQAVCHNLNCHRRKFMNRELSRKATVLMFRDPGVIHHVKEAQQIDIKIRMITSCTNLIVK